MHTEIVFVRHGQTQSNVMGLLHGRTDVPLTALGLQQAECVARRVAEIETIDYLYSSPLLRARSTAEKISKRIGLDIRFHDDLVEIDFGDFEGYTLAGIEDEHPELYRRIIDLEDMELKFPNGESRGGFHTRVRRVIDSLVDQHRGERVVVVAHGGVIASGLAQLTAADPNDWTAYQVRNCSVTHVQLLSGGETVVYCRDDVAHLDLEEAV